MSKDRNFGLLVIPALAILGVITFYPVGFSLYLSFMEWNWGGVSRFVGWQNFQHILSSGSFGNALFNAFYFAFFAVVIETCWGFALALAVHRLGQGAGLVRTVLLMPLMISGIAVSLIWKVMLDPTTGIINYLLSIFGISGPAWLGHTSYAMPSLIMIDVWWQTAFTFIILSAALKSLPQEPFEAAKVEGANSLQCFFYITLPLLKPVLITIIMFRTIDTLKVFDIIFGTTGGGPLRTTETVQTLAYQTAFKSFRFGEAAAISVLFSLIILSLAIFYLVFGKRHEEKI